MSPPRAELVIRGQVLVAAQPRGIETAEAVGIAAGRIVAVGPFTDVADASARGARVVDARDSAVVPGIHDFHIHLVGLARSRLAIALDDAADGREVLGRVASAARGVAPGSWLVGRGWGERHLAGIVPEPLERALDGRLAFMTSHDGHSAWASAAALRLAGITAETGDPLGGRIERDGDGTPTGVLRETATELVAPLVVREQGDDLRSALEHTLRDLAGFGITGATEAGDYTDHNGIGSDAALGDSYSTLTDLADAVDGRLRLSIGIPAVAIAAAADRGLRTGVPLRRRRTLRFGWAKEYADGALGSGTAALFEPATCGAGDTGIMRVTPEHLDGLIAAGRAAGIGLAVHAIGDRAVSAVLDAVGRAPARAPGVPADRMEHVQLLRGFDAARFAALDVTASVQPIHAAADRDLVDACWRGRADRAYAWRTLVSAGARLAAGSDAPVESVNPWIGIFAAVHRRFVSDERDDWTAAQALSPAEALSAYTLGPARSLGRTDEGHLNLGARADLAVLSVGLDALRAADDRLADVRSTVTLVDGLEVPLA